MSELPDRQEDCVRADLTPPGPVDTAIHSASERSASDVNELYLNVKIAYWDRISTVIKKNLSGHGGAEAVERLTVDTFSEFWCTLSRGNCPWVTAQNWQEVEHETTIRIVLYRIARFAKIRSYLRDQRWITNVENDKLVQSLKREAPIPSLDLLAILECCPPAEREALVLREDGWTDAEIAERQGVKESTVRGRRSRARQLLQGQLTRLL